MKLRITLWYWAESISGRIHGFFHDKYTGRLAVEVGKKVMPVLVRANELAPNMTDSVLARSAKLKEFRTMCETLYEQETSPHSVKDSTNRS